MNPREQIAILGPVVAAYRTLVREQTGRAPNTLTTMASFRDSLRLDDPILEALILTGAHRQPWSTPSAVTV